ncbi:unnamed protein product [Rhizophagus irregularis]|nr:unnamed protein product [Rhizophagus irregularis]
MIHYSYAEESEMSQLIKLNWFTPLTYKKKGSSIGASKGGLGSAATLLPDNKIICMGGAGDKSTLMNLVYIYDTINDFWSTKVTSGTVPHNKLGSTAVIGLDGQRVIVFGGTDIANAPKIPLYELNLITFE